MAPNTVACLKTRMSQDSRQFSFFSTRDYRAAISQAERVRVIIRGEECALAALPSNGRHFHNNDSCILSASRLITLSLPLKKCSFVKIDAFTPPASPLLRSAALDRPIAQFYD